MVNYRDEHGGWIAKLDDAGNFLGGQLVEPSALFEQKRALPLPTPVLPMGERLAPVLDTIAKDPALAPETKAALQQAILILAG